MSALFLPRRLDPVPVSIMDGVMGIFDPPHTWTHIPKEIHLPLAHLQCQEINLRQSRHMLNTLQKIIVVIYFRLRLPCLVLIYPLNKMNTDTDFVIVANAHE